MDKRLAARRMRRKRETWGGAVKKNSDVSVVGGRCQKCVITWGWTDSIVEHELQPALQYPAQGAAIGLGTYSQAGSPRRDAQSPKHTRHLLRSVFTSQDDVSDAGRRDIVIVKFRTDKRLYV